MEGVESNGLVIFGLARALAAEFLSPSLNIDRKSLMTVKLLKIEDLQIMNSMQKLWASFRLVA